MKKALIFPLFFALMLIPILPILIHPVYGVRREYIYPTDDAPVWRWQPDTNYGGSALPFIGNCSWILANDEAIAFFKFDLTDFDPDLEANEEVSYTGIYFDLYCHHYYDWREYGINLFTLGYSSNETWLETQITWNDQPSYEETHEDVLINDDEMYFRWDCSEIDLDIMYAIENDMNYTLVITFDGYESQGCSVRMREYGGLISDPRLVVEYNILLGEQPTYETEINLAMFPQALGEVLQIGLFGGQMLASTIVIMMFMLPTSFYAKNNPFPYIIVGIPVLGFLVAITWLPLFFLFIICVLIAFLFSDKLKGWATRRG